MVLLQLVVLGAGALILVYWLKLKSSKFEGIPEPPCNFILGHVLSLRGHIPKTFLKWRKSVGPVFQIRVFGFRSLVLNDRESITKCCSKPEASGRWKVGIAKSVMERYGGGLISTDGPHAEEQRQFYVKSFRTMGFGRSKLETDILYEIDQVVQAWREASGKPFELEGFAAHYSANAAWNLLGSKRFSKAEADVLEHCLSKTTAMETLQQRLNLLFTGTMEKVSRTCRELLSSYGTVLVAACSDLIESHLKDRVPNSPRDVIDMLLDRMDASKNPNSPFHQNNLKNAFMLPELLAASLHTTSKTLEWFVVYLAKHPQTQSRLQKEIEAVVGSTEEPVQLHHRDQMPYAQACIFEVLRMSSLVSLAMPHAAMETFDFNGAKIPKGTIIIANLYAAHHDPEVWDQPQEFKPERFLTPKGRLDTNVTSNVIAFGAGRRACIGTGVAMDVLFLFVANVYKEFHIQVPNCPENIEGRFGINLSPPAGLEVKAVPRIARQQNFLM